MSTFSAADEYPKLLHEFELAEQRITKLEAELVDAIEALSNEQETRVLMESERDKLESELITETDCTEKAEAELAEEKFMREITDTGLCGAEEELKKTRTEAREEIKRLEGELTDMTSNVDAYQKDMYPAVCAKRDEALRACRAVVDSFNKDKRPFLLLEQSIGRACDMAKAVLDD